MRQRSINFSAAMREMRNHRSPEKRLMDEMISAMKEAEAFMSTVLRSDDLGLAKFRSVIKKAEARHV